jgi:hypothetical protein
LRSANRVSKFYTGERSNLTHYSPYRPCEKKCGVFSPRRSCLNASGIQELGTGHPRTQQVHLLLERRAESHRPEEQVRQLCLSEAVSTHSVQK